MANDRRGIEDKESNRAVDPDAREKPDLDEKEAAAARNDVKAHDSKASPYATEQHWNEEQAKRNE